MTIKVLSLSLIFSAAALRISAQDINIAGLYNTGQGQSEAGEQALYYNLVSSPGNAYSTAYVSTNDYGGWNQSFAPAAGWITPQSNGDADIAVGTFDYQLVFNLENAEGQALDPTTAQITGSFLVDDHFTLEINGQEVPGAIDIGPESYADITPHGFDITSDFQPGLNTLDFIVDNDVGPSGLLVDFSSGTANVSAVPEPSTLALAAAGGLAGLLARRRRK